MSDSIDQRNHDDFVGAIALAQHTVYKKYLPELSSYPIVAPTQVLLDENAENCLRFLKLEEFTCKKGEDIFQKLSTVYHASMSLGCNLIVMVDVEKIDAPAKIYIGVRNDGNNSQARADLGTSYRTLKSGIKSNFPGSKLSDIPSIEVMPKVVEDIFGDASKHISSVSCVASIRDKSKTENKNFVQGLERLIDAMSGHTYTAIFIAEPINNKEQVLIRNGYESLYSALSPFRKSAWSFNENNSVSVMESLSNGVSIAVTEGTSHTQAHTKSIGVNIGINSSQSNSNTVSDTMGDSKTKPSIINIITLGIIGISNTHSISSTIASTIAKTLGLSGGLNVGYASTTSDTTMHNVTEGTSETNTTGTTDSKGSGKTLQIENLNKPVEEMLMRIEEHLKRVKESEDYGSYSAGAYFLSGKQESSLLAASTYRALMVGEGSSVESGAINTWNGIYEPEKIRAIKQYLSRFIHPILAMPISDTPTDETDFVTYSPGTIVSGLELPLHLGLPTRSVYGLPVIEHAEFGRNVTRKDASLSLDKERIKIGRIYHMGQVEKKSIVDLDMATLTSHTFITGSTGSGKSNTIYAMLGRLNEQSVKFLVVEPAKGEYKSAFRNRNDVTVYGTNPKISEWKMLRINPFSFPPSVHVLEHMDRLVEIFNVCWPMYAAMPAILKDAIERAYSASGWDLINSENKYDENLFPTFSDVLVQIKVVLNESEYSADNKGDYIGSLATRLKSLTNGINGLIFTTDDIPDTELFDENVIVDLSRVGSAETKALIMGLLVLKLQEYRMQILVPNQKIHHVTVLEEAHNLLRRTSTEQSSESSNLLGKSVEMLANAIAEMRTYGEGFIIADQSPGLLDMSVIRNTNTKIILRLPDFSDRELVGKAAGLNDTQIIELGRLEKGVASISQTDWLEPVLCKIDKNDGEDAEVIFQPYGYRFNEPMVMAETDVIKSLLDCIMNNEIYRKGDRVDIENLRYSIIRSRLDSSVKCRFIEYIQAEKDNAVESLRKLIFDFLKAEDAIKASTNFSEMKDWANSVVEKLNPSIRDYSKQQLDLVLALIIIEQAHRDSNYNVQLCRFTEIYQENGGVI